MKGEMTETGEVVVSVTEETFCSFKTVGASVKCRTQLGIRAGENLLIRARNHLVCDLGDARRGCGVTRSSRCSGSWLAPSGETAAGKMHGNIDF